MALFNFSKTLFFSVYECFHDFFQLIGYIRHRKMPSKKELYIFLQKHPYKNSSKKIVSEKFISGETFKYNQITFLFSRVFSELTDDSQLFNFLLK